jgi:hypothetical protein
MESPLIAIAAAAALAGCGGGTHGSPSAAHHTAWSPAAASAISTAFRKECSGFDAAYAKIQSATQGETTVGQLMATLTGGLGNTADDWGKQLSTAAKAADMPGVPEGATRRAPWR